MTHALNSKNLSYQSISDTIYKVYGSGSGNSAGDAGWNDILTVTLDLGSDTRDVIAMASFQAATNSGAASAWDVVVRIEINGNAGTERTRTLAGSNDNGLGSSMHLLESQTGVVTVKFQAQDDGSHTVAINPITLFVLGM